MPQTRQRKQFFRRYPALLLVAAAAALAVLLPTALNLPRTDPSSLAELAPVPGQGGAQGDLGRLGSGADRGAGSGIGGGTGATSGGAALPGQNKLQIKRCVGNPPRQTEDPLSPPCVASFTGANGGASTRGVTADEIVAYMWWPQTGQRRTADYAAPLTTEEKSCTSPCYDTIGKAYARYFNDRFQTYGRYVHFYGVHSMVGAPGTTIEQAYAEVEAIDEKNSLALIPGHNAAFTASVSRYAAQKGMIVAANAGFESAFYESVAPRLFSYAPDLEDSADIAANYVCVKLRGRPARYSGNATDLGSTRVFGLLYTTSNENPSIPAFARLLKSEMKRQCNLTPKEEALEGNGQATWDDYPVALARLRNEGVTTMIVVTKDSGLLHLNAASGMSWRPEWFLPRQGDLPDDTASARVYPPDQWRHAFGISNDYRRNQIDDQPWARAFREACPDCAALRGYFAGETYSKLLLLFYGIQAAGPRLSPVTLDRGLHAIPERPSTSPYVPASYFRPGNYSWVKDAKEMWWDPSGIPPGDTQPGCYRLANDGRRFRTGEWRPGDDDLFRDGAPCQGPAQL